MLVTSTQNGSSDQSLNESINQSINQSYDPSLLSLLPQLQTVLPENQSTDQSINQLMHAITDIISGCVCNENDFIARINQSISQSEDALDSTVLVQLIQMKYAESLQRVRHSYNHPINQSTNQSIDKSANDSAINQSVNHQFLCSFLSFLSLTPHFLPTRSFTALIDHTIKQYGLYYLFDHATSAHQSINQSNNASINQSNNMPANQSIKRPAQQSAHLVEQQVRKCLSFAASYGLNHVTNQSINLIVQRGFSHFLFDSPGGSICFRTLQPFHQCELLIVQLITQPNNQSINRSTNQSIHQSHVLALLQSLTDRLKQFDLHSLYKLATITDPDQSIKPLQSVDSHSRIVLMELHIRALIEISKISTNQSINQSARHQSNSRASSPAGNKSTNQSPNQSPNQSTISLPASQSTSRKVSHSNSFKIPSRKSFRQNSLLSFYGTGEESINQSIDDDYQSINHSNKQSINQLTQQSINEIDDESDEDDDDDYYTRAHLQETLVQHRGRYRTWLILAACIDANDWLLAASIHQSNNQLIDWCECMLSHYRSINQFQMEHAIELIDSSIKQVPSQQQQARLLTLVINQSIKFNLSIEQLEQELIDRMDWIAPCLRLALSDDQFNQSTDQSTNQSTNQSSHRSVFTAALHLSLTTHCLRVLHDQSINQSIKQHIGAIRMTGEILNKLTINCQPRVATIDRSIKQPVKQPTHHFSSQAIPSIHQSSNQSTSQFSNQSTHQTVFFTCGHSFTESAMSVALAVAQSKLSELVPTIPMTTQLVLSSFRRSQERTLNTANHPSLIQSACPDCALVSIQHEHAQERMKGRGNRNR